MKVNDAISGVLLFVLGASVLFAIRGFPNIPGQPVGPALFPGLIAVGLCLGGAMLVFGGLRHRAEQPWVVWDDWVNSPRHALAFVLLVAGIIFYIVASEWLGFLPCAVIILMALFAVLRVPLPRAALVAVIAALAIHFAFYKLLRVPLPWGLLMPIAW